MVWDYGKSLENDIEHDDCRVQCVRGVIPPALVSSKACQLLVPFVMWMGSDSPGPKVRPVEVSVVKEIDSLTRGVETGLHMGRDQATFMICKFEKWPMNQNLSVVILCVSS